MILFAVFGYPKIPFLGIPIGFIVLVFDWKNVLGLCKNNIGQVQIFVCFVFFIFCLLRVLVGDGLFWEKNLFFCLTLCYKAFVGLYSAFIFIYLVDRKKSLVELFIFIQISLMALSAFNKSIYDFLLFFQTSEATTVFGEIFGLRSIGFGLIHNEGVILLTLIYVLYHEFSSASRFLLNALGVLTYFSAFSSRLVLVLLPIWQVIRNKTLFVFVLILLTILVRYLDVEQGSLSQVFELYNYYNETGSIGSKSTNAILDMNYIPDSLEAWLIGDGQFFSDVGFYKDTDIGFSRIIFFGGLIGFFLYFMLCCWPLYILRKYMRGLNWALLLFILYVYVAGNLKGITIQSFSFTAFLYFSHRLNPLQKSS